MLKLFLKIYPAFLPILVYIFWVYVIKGLILKRLLKKEKTIEGEKIVGQKATKENYADSKIGNFSLQNRYFVAVLYMSLISAILTLVFLAFL